MAQWGKTDAASNSVFWGSQLFNKVANSANRTALYGNSTVDAFVSGQYVGMYGVDSTEMGVGSGGLVFARVTDPGSGYTANGTVTVTATNGGTSGAANAQANSVGKIAAVNITVAGSGYITPPNLTLSAPANTTFNANSAVTGGAGGGANSVITISSAGSFQNNDPILYQVASGNTAIDPLVSGTWYYVQFANSTVVALSETPGGARITLTKGLTEAGHALQGETATAVVDVGGSQGVAHAGWVVRKEGTGGRAGRVQYETLVAMKSMTGDGSDDASFPDS